MVIHFETITSNLNSCFLFFYWLFSFNANFPSFFFSRFHLPICSVPPCILHSCKYILAHQPWVSSWSTSLNFFLILCTLITEAWLTKFLQHIVIVLIASWLKCRAGTWIRVSVWLTVGALIYVSYGQSHSRLSMHSSRQTVPAEDGNCNCMRESFSTNPVPITPPR